MKCVRIEKGQQGKFITRYDITYETSEGKEKVYEIISRNQNLTCQEELYKGEAEAVVLIMHDKSGEKILLNREFRMAVGEFVYNFPAGLIEKGETPKKSGERELWEETGLKLVEVTDYIGTSYSAVGFSNEKNVCLVGVAEGEIKPSIFAEEEIEAGWYTKEQIKEMLQTEKFAARTQAYCYMWSKM